MLSIFTLSGGRVSAASGASVRRHRHVNTFWFECAIDLVREVEAMAFEQDSSPAAGRSLKKIIHNSIERRRKDKIVEWIDKINELLPYRHELGPRVSRTSLLEHVYKYIVELRNKNDALMFANPQSVHGNREQGPLTAQILTEVFVQFARSKRSGNGLKSCKGSTKPIGRCWSRREYPPPRCCPIQE